MCPVNCSLSIAAKVLVVSGKDSGNNFVTESEVIDLSNPSKSCQPWVNHPTGTSYAAGAFLDSQVILCGGETPDKDHSTDCHAITPTNTVAIVSLIVGSSSSAAIEFQEKLLLSGGFGGKIHQRIETKSFPFSFACKR